MATHKDHDYTGKNDQVCKNYTIILEEISRACQAANVKATGASFDRVCEEVLSRAAYVPDCAGLSLAVYMRCMRSRWSTANKNTVY